MHSRAHEQELRHGLGDLVALSAFPGLLADDEPAKLAEHLAELLRSTLRLDLAYACVRDQSGSVHEATESDPLAEAVLSETPGAGSLHMLNRWEHWRGSTDVVVQHSGRTFHISMRSIGSHAEWGLLGAASERPEFPTPLEATKFQIIANYTWALVRTQRLRDSYAPSEPNAGLCQLPPAWFTQRLPRTRPYEAHAVVPARAGVIRPTMAPTELKASLKRLGMSQHQLARSISVSVGTVKKWAQGKSKIPGPAILLIELMLHHAPR